MQQEFEPKLPRDILKMSRNKSFYFRAGFGAICSASKTKKYLLKNSAIGNRTADVFPRYQRCELCERWRVIPDVVGAIPKGLNKSLQNIGIRVRPGHVQKDALLGTARILQRVLEI